MIDGKILAPIILIFGIKSFEDYSGRSPPAGKCMIIFCVACFFRLLLIKNNFLEHYSNKII